MEPPSLESFAIALLTIAVLGALTDRLILSTRLTLWRRRVGALWLKLNTPGARGLLADANQVYLDLFDEIYGERSFSRRRAIASAVSTSVSLTFVVLMLGYSATIFPELWEALRTIDDDMLVALGLVVLMNFVPDFFSLIETRLVLGWARGRSALTILLLLVLDFCLTSVVFLVGVFVWFKLMDTSETFMGIPGL